MRKMISFGASAALFAAAADAGAAPAAADTGPVFLPKMTVATLGTVPARAKAEKKRVHLCRIIGSASSTKLKTDQAGEPIVAIVGNFEGTNVETGAVAQSSVLYLPGGIQEVIENAVDSRDDKNAAVPFALDVFAKPDNNKAGYTYDVEFIQKPQGRLDPLEALRTAAAEAKPLADVKA